MTSNNYIKACKTKDNIEDETLKLATNNIKMAEDLEGDLQIYQETVHPHYEENRDKCLGLISQLEEKQGMFSRGNAIKVLKKVAAEKYKESKKIQQNFSKGNKSKDEFLEEFINSRKEFY